MADEEEVFTANEARLVWKLPTELVEMAREYLNADGEELPMGVEEARDHRKKLEKERTAFVNRLDEDWRSTSYVLGHP